MAEGVKEELTSGVSILSTAVVAAILIASLAWIELIKEGGEFEGAEGSGDRTKDDRARFMSPNWKWRAAWPERLSARRFGLDTKMMGLSEFEACKGERPSTMKSARTIKEQQKDLKKGFQVRIYSSCEYKRVCRMLFRLLKESGGGDLAW
ncbi:hypothetical protein PHJA_002467400 [Phtheirospermum japonicum]|uniref:Uncharacterized protein n=1 Tax=Phtheirospermum japonicum TaxID=374723 RepID=A0A830D7W1_9LAMI|nr:hypothetical protein PHJA_002467400 [Phtheirospermum japonicum]